MARNPAEDAPLLLPPQHLSSEMEQGRPKLVRGRVVASQVKRPHVAATLSTIDNILWSELKTLESVVANGQTLDEEQLRRFRYLSEIAHAQMKETRDQEKHEKLEELSDAELLQRAREAEKFLGGGE